MTGLKRARVVALERGGLHRLRSLARSGGCGGAGTAGGGTATNGGTAGAAPGTGAAPGQQPQIGVAGERQAGAAQAQARPTTPAANASHDDGRPLLHPPDEPLDFVPIVAAFGVAILVFALLRERRRSA
jgi:hypothetical protein